MSWTQQEVDELARKVSNLQTEASEVAVLLQVGLGRDHELTESASVVQAATEKLLRQLRRFMVGKPEQPYYSQQSAG